ncbi:sulfite exporter TauE/SafE family protein [Methylobacterium mesophilicum]|uniref:sulfite exporter TauE/SafE family protein n=1 Tax=Methylobacterium mesophilicum TaxID=39956 RepID=UPI002F2FCE95
MLIHVVGLRDAHVAVGTGAFAVAACSLFDLVGPLRIARFPWEAAGLFGCAGILAATLGAGLGKQLDGHRLQCLFALVMLAAASMTFRRRFNPASPGSGRVPPAPPGRTCSIRCWRRSSEVQASHCRSGDLGRSDDVESPLPGHVLDLRRSEMRWDADHGGQVMS